MAMITGEGHKGQVPPQNLERGDANANCPTPDLSYRYKNEHSVAFKIRQNPFSAGALARTPLGELLTLPQTLCRLERGHPSPYPIPLGTDHLRRSPCVPQKSSQIYAYVHGKGMQRMRGTELTSIVPIVER